MWLKVDYYRGKESREYIDCTRRSSNLLKSPSQNAPAPSLNEDAVNYRAKCQYICPAKQMQRSHQNAIPHVLHRANTHPPERTQLCQAAHLELRLVRDHLVLVGAQ